MTHDSKNLTLSSFTDVFADELVDSQPISLSSTESQSKTINIETSNAATNPRPQKHTGQYGNFRSVDEIIAKYRSVFTYPFFNLVQSNVIEDALYSDKSMVVCAPTGSGKTVVFEMAIVQLLMELEDNHYTDDFKIIYMAPVKAICTERLTEWYSKFTKLGLLCIEVTGDTNVDFSQLKPYRIIITTPEKWDLLTRRWTDYRGLVGVIKLFLIDEVHILNDETRGPVLETVVSRMKAIESSSQSAFRIEQLQRQYRGEQADPRAAPPRIRFVAVSATVSNPEDVAAWLSSSEKPAVYHKFGDECRPVKIKRIVEGYPCGEGTSIFKFDIILNYKLWPIIQKYYDGKPTLIFCNTRKSVGMTAETLARELTINFNAEQKAKLTTLASTIKNKKLQALVLSGVGCHHAGLLFEERVNIERAFRQRDLPILITTTTLAMGVNLPAHLVIIKNTQQYVSGAFQEYSISTVLQMVGRAGRPQFDTEATAVIMTRLQDKHRYQALVGGSEPLQSYLHKRLPENLNSEAALRTVSDVAQCVEWLRSTFLYIRAAKDPRRYLGLPPAAAPHQISKKIEELCVKAMNGLATSGLITMDEASCIESTEAGRLMSVYYLDFETMKRIMKIRGTETLEQLLWVVCESHELGEMHLRVDERRCLNALNRSSATTIRFPMKGKVTTRQMKLNCVIQAILGCLPIPDPSLNQESLKIMRVAQRVCKCLLTYTTRSELIATQPQFYSAVLNSILLAKCIAAHLWEASPFVSKQLKGIGPTISNLLATAGKVTFMLLEEAHPRDLERIMNKGPPAGNILRKQVSLLPKYKLTMSPVDERTVSIELSLLNQSHLAENMDALTAGDGHQSYIVVGDSENHILLLVSFKDNNLITVFDGTITHTVTRKHRYEHKVFAHCISSTFVGIDVQAEYIFKDLDPKLIEINEVNAEPIEETPRRTATKQTNITDSFKERKRRNTELDICQSKEKKKRSNALIDKLKTLKESFGRTNKELQDDLKKSEEISNALLNKIGHKEQTATSSNDIDVTGFEFDEDIESHFLKNYSVEATNANQSSRAHEEPNMDDSRINSLLNDIENEISNTVQPKTCSTYFEQKDVDVRQPVYSKLNSLNDKIKSRFAKPAKKTDNFSFIDLLEKNVDFTDDEVLDEQPKQTGFSEAIKCHVQQYLQKARETTTKQTNWFQNQDLFLGIHQPAKCRITVNLETDPITTHEEVDTHEATTIQDADLLECKLQNNQALIHNILEDQKESRIDNIEDEILDEDVEKNKDYEYDQQLHNKDGKNNIDYLIRKHVQINTKSKNTDGLDTRQKDISEVRALFRNMSTASGNLCTVARDYTLNYNPEGAENSIKEKAMGLVSNAETESNKVSEKQNSYQDDRNEEVAVTENWGILPLNFSDQSMLAVGSEITDVFNASSSVMSFEAEVSRNLVPYNDRGLTPAKSDSQTRSRNVDNYVPNYSEDKTRTPFLTALKPVMSSDSRKLVQFGDNHRMNTLESKIGTETRSFNNHEVLENKPATTAATRKPIFERQLQRSRFPPTEHFQQYGSYNTTSSINHSIESPKRNRQNVHHMKKYTYIATEIGVWTKQNESRTLQVINKLTVDLDITEIESEKKIYRRGDGHYGTVNHNDKSSSPLTPRVAQLTETSKRHNNVHFTNDYIPQVKELKRSFVTKTSKNLTSQDSSHTEKCIEPDPIDWIAKGVVEVAEQRTDINQRDVEKPLEDVGRSAVESILQKYINVLRKTTESSQMILNSQPISSQPISQKTKLKRPFKISDIHRVEASLPESIIIASSPGTPSLLTTTPSNNYNSLTEHNEDLQNTQRSERPATQLKEERITFSAQFDSAQLNSVVIEEVEMPDTDALDNEFNIDYHSMFDPKMLLQCYMNKPQEGLPVIPPPPQFCDTNIKIGNGVYEPSSTVESVIEKNNLEYENEGLGMTPGKEIEAWTFDEEDQEPAKSLIACEILKNPPFLNYNGGYNISSKARLGQFKFTAKPKFSVRRK